MSNNTTRFSDRVEDYVKYRPHYPGAVLSYLQAVYSFDPGWVVADVGSGTGISTELFLSNGNRVYGVEPNAEMRAKAEELLGGYKGAASGDGGVRGAAAGAGAGMAGAGTFVSVDGTAEATGLAGDIADLILSGQAFHWFEPVATRAEFVRIAKPGAVVALIWNEREIRTAFEQEYEALIQQHAGEYKTVNHRNITDEQIGAFFRPQSFVLQTFENEQLFHFEGLRGRLLSSSYTPKEGPAYEGLMTDLRILFDRHQSGGQVRVGYDTKLYTGVIK